MHVIWVIILKNFIIIYKKVSPHKNILFGKYKDDKFII